jgi:hypothetical protein
MPPQKSYTFPSRSKPNCTSDDYIQIEVFKNKLVAVPNFFILIVIASALLGTLLYGVIRNKLPH